MNSDPSAFFSLLISFGKEIPKNGNENNKVIEEKEEGKTVTGK